LPTAIKEGANVGLEITLRVNGVARQLPADPRTTLLDALRMRLGLTDPRKGFPDQATGASLAVGIGDDEDPDGSEGRSS
jgi:aerobic-type carbon monoxide dehydrogenase small subunit (CoxS/CutS family)